MFDQLDDPDGFAPSSAFRTGVRRRARQLSRRRRARRLATAAVVPVVGLGVAVIGLDRRLDSVQRVEIGDGRGPDPLDTGGPVTLLVLGTDAAPNDPARAQVAGTHSDVIVVARIDPAGRRVSTLSIPRDLWTGTTKASALSPADLTGWLAEHLGIEVDHLISMDMDGFARLADRIGPEVDVALPVRDRSTGLDLDAGCQRLDGDEALAYVRSRHLQDLPGDPSSWRNDPTGDLGRIARLQSLVTAVWSQVSRLGPTDVPALVDVLTDTTVLDADLTTRDLVALARLLISSPSQPATATLPTTMASVPLEPSTPAGSGAMSVVSVRPEDPRTDEALASVAGHLSRTAPTLPPPPASVETFIPSASAALGLVSAC